MMKSLIIYHKNCMDGFGAAWVAYKYHRNCQPFFIAGDAGKIDAVINQLKNINLSEYDEVISFDLSWTEESLNNLVELCPNVKVFDHHISCAKTSVVHFDNTISGVMLAWNYYYPGVVPPKTLLYIQERDLWSYNLPYSKEINSALHIKLPIGDFNAWTEFIDNEEVKLEEARHLGIELEQARLEKIKQIYSHKTIQTHGKYKVCVIETNERNLRSDLAAYAYSQKDENGNWVCDYVLMWVLSDTNEYWVSLRSNNKRVDSPDVSEIAQSFAPNGGGHKHASGFSVSGNLFVNGEIIFPTN